MPGRKDVLWYIRNLTIITLDENKNLVSNVSVQIFSNNRAIKKRLNIGANCTTDSKGSCEIKIGGGNYAIKGEKKDDGIYLSAETAITLVENKNSSIQLNAKERSFLVAAIFFGACACYFMLHIMGFYSSMDRNKKIMKET